MALDSSIGSFVIGQSGIGTSSGGGSINSRLLSLLPAGWFGDQSTTTAPIANAVVAGPAAALLAIYSLAAVAKGETRIATMTGGFLDLAAYDFFGRNFQRLTNETDASFAARLTAEFFRPRVTRAAMQQVLTSLTGAAPVIFEPWNTGDCGGWSSRAVSTPGYMGWGTRTGGGAGLWGSRLIPAAALMTVYRPSGTGVASMGGWSSRVSSTWGSYAGWSSRGAPSVVASVMLGWVNRAELTSAVPDALIYSVINMTKPQGVQVYARLI